MHGEIIPAHGGAGVYSQLNCAIKDREQTRRFKVESDELETEYEWRNPQDLKEHPDQEVSFLQLDDTEFALLKRSIETHGQRDPVEITANDIIIDGHHRVRAAIELGLEEILVWVRDDLSERDAALRTIDANLERRHLGQLGKTRALVRQREIRRGRLAGSIIENPGFDTKAIAEALGKTPRHTRRWLNLLKELPMELQVAVDSNLLKQCTAEKVCGLSDTVKNEIVDEIKAGASVEETCCKHIPKPIPKPRTRARILLSAQKTLQEVLELKWRSVRTGLNAAQIENLLMSIEELVSLLPRYQAWLRAASLYERRLAEESSADLQQALRDIGFPETFEGDNCD